MVAAMILILGAVAIFKIVDAATRTSYRAEQSQVVSNLLQRELERVKAMQPAEMVVSLNASPGIEACVAERDQAIAQSPGAGSTTPITADQVVARADGTIFPCETELGSAADGAGGSDVQVRVFRMVTWYDPDKESCKPPEAAANAEEACGMRRITIGAIPEETGPGGERAYKEIQSDVIDLPGEG